MLKRISYVEDDPDIRAITELALTEIGGFELDVCDSGPEVLDRAPEFKPDLILLDVMMPGMDGIETFKRLAELPELAATPIVFMTAKTMQHEVKRYQSMGAMGVIPKPFDPVTLPQRLRKIWRQSGK